MNYSKLTETSGAAEIEFQQDIIGVGDKYLAQINRLNFVGGIVKITRSEFFDHVVIAFALKGDMVDGAGRIAGHDLTRGTSTFTKSLPGKAGESTVDESLAQLNALLGETGGQVTSDGTVVNEPAA